MNRFLFISALVAFNCTAFAGTPQKRLPLIPYPQYLTQMGEKYVKLKQVTESIDTTLDLPAEGYLLQVGKNGRVTITAKDQQGRIWGRRTLEQLQKGEQVPQVEIRDYPAFSFRAFMHDTGRNFIPLDMLKRHIDLLSRYKVNVFHWHLTDHPAWRIQSYAYPELNDPKFQRSGRDTGKFYTYDEIRELIAYARERGVMVMPEIDMPGHSTFFDTTFGCGMSSPKGMEILEKCLNEFFAEIPASSCSYFHLGSDEVHIPNPVEFMAWADSIARANGRIPMVWDPGLKASSSTIRQIWSDVAAEATELNRESPYVDSFMGYLNLYDPILFVNRMFLHNPCGRAGGDSLALGGILCLWNDVRVADKENIVRHNGAWTGLLPYSERFWTGGWTPDGVTDNPNLLPAPGTPAGQALAEFENRMKYHKDHLLAEEAFYWTPNAALEWNATAPVVKGRDTTGVARYPLYGGTLDLEAFRISVGAPQADSLEVWAETTIRAEQDTTIRCWIGFETPARSNRLSCGIGRQGEWENGGRIWVNGAEVAPPVWKEPGAYRFLFNTWARPEEELSYTDEQLYWMRTPTEIRLRKGDNMIRLYAPKTFVNQRWTVSFMPVE